MRSRRVLKGKHLWIGIGLAVAAVLAFALFVANGGGGYLNRVLLPTMRPLWMARASAGEELDFISESLGSRSSLVEENLALKQRVAKVKALEVRVRFLEAENKRLKALLGREGTHGKRVLAAILVRPSQSLYDTIVVDAGTGLGVRPGDRVVAEGSILLGEVTSAARGLSQVELYSSPGVTTGVLVGTDQVSAEAAGRGGGNFLIELPREVPVSADDVVSVPDTTNLIVGAVDSVRESPAEPFKQILFRSPVNIQQIKWVEVIIGNETPS